MSESRDHVLVKWKDDDKWDVYPIRNIKSVEKQCMIADDPRVIKEMACETVEVMWKDGEFAPAYILATGTAAAMERKRRRVAMASPPETTAPKRKCSCGKEGELEAAQEKISSLEQELEAAKGKVKRLKEEREEARALVDVKKLVKKLTKAAESKPSAVAAAPVEKVDIGNNVLVDTQLLARLKLSAGKQPTKFARNLLRAVFTPEELAVSSLYGKPCNVKKDVPAKKALDSARLDAVVSYTCATFGCPPREISGSLSTMLARGQFTK
ncbi:uncharacterized protein LOC144148979 [Haemaphysalis longicornis]